MGFYLEYTSGILHRMCYFRKAFTHFVKVHLEMFSIFFGATHPSQTFFTVSLMINHLMGPTGAAPSLGVVVPIPEGTLSRWPIPRVTHASRRDLLLEGTYASRGPIPWGDRHLKKICSSEWSIPRGGPVPRRDLYLGGTRASRGPVLWGDLFLEGTCALRGPITW
jgi:hypothetical protein